MKIFDISLPISPELPVYPGDPPVILTPLASIAGGDGANLSQVSLSAHCGTHLDAPFHYLANGTTVDQIPLGLLLGTALVVELPGVIAIGREELAALPLTGVERLLLKTDNSAHWSSNEFCREYACLSDEGASFLLETGVRLVGIDSLSIESFPGDGSVHRMLLGKGIIILEGLNLAEVKGGRYELVCLPLNIIGADGAPARAVLRAKDHLVATGDFDPHTSRWPLS